MHETTKKILSAIKENKFNSVLHDLRTINEDIEIIAGCLLAHYGKGFETLQMLHRIWNTGRRSTPIEPFYELCREAVQSVMFDRYDNLFYHNHASFKKQWLSPRVLPESFEEIALDKWFPGRIDKVEEDKVTVLYASVSMYERRHIDVYMGEYDHSSWEKMSDIPPIVDFYIELGKYGDLRLIRNAHFPDFANDRSDLFRFIELLMQ